MTPSRPPIWLRLCVVIGACTLVLGLVGAGYLLVHGDEEAPAVGPGLAPRLQLDGLAGQSPDTLRVTASWHDAEADLDLTQTGVALATRPYEFFLPPDSAGRTVRIDVYDDSDDPPRLLASEERRVTREDIVVMKVEGGGAVPLRR